MAQNSVGPNQLQSTAVTAGSYTTADITVDEDGRITAASSGSAGSPLFQVTLAEKGPTSGNFTANPNTTIITAYAGGGGGGPGFAMGTDGTNKSGGDGSAGFFFFPISQPFGPHPFSVGGGGGTSGSPNSRTGQPGGATTLTPSPISAPGGSGGPANANAPAQNTVTPGPAAIDMTQNGLFRYGLGAPRGPRDPAEGFLVIYENILS